MPAMLSATKGETKDLAGRFGIESRGAYGCPLINEVHKRHPHMRRFSIQRVLRETRAGVLEPGEALRLIMRTLYLISVSIPYITRNIPTRYPTSCG